MILPHMKGERNFALQNFTRYYNNFYMNINLKEINPYTKIRNLYEYKNYFYLYKHKYEN